MAALIPMVSWAQLKDKLFLTIEVPGVEANPTIKLDNDNDGGTILVEAKGEAGKTYKLDLKLLKKINPAESKVSVQRHITLALAKEEEGPYWNKLTRGPGKDNHTHIKVDWNRWVDEDEEDDKPNPGGFDMDAMKDYSSFMGGPGGMGGMEGMMGGMGGMGGMAGMMGGMGGMMGGMGGGMGGFGGGMQGFEGLGGEDGEGHDSDDDADLPDLEK